LCSRCEENQIARWLGILGDPGIRIEDGKTKNGTETVKEDIEETES
jgi:hypothetical protein